MYVCLWVGRVWHQWFLVPYRFVTLKVSTTIPKSGSTGIFFFDLVRSVRLEFGEGKTWATLYLPFMGLETGVIFVIQKLSNVCIVIEVNYL